MHPHVPKFSVQYGNYRTSIVQNLFIFVACIIQGKTTNLYELRNEVGKITEKCKTETESHYKRLTRFILLNSFGNLWYFILCYGLDLLNLKLNVCYLDGTEWYIGSFKLHILVLAVDYQGIAIPIYFQCYNHKGVLSEFERIQFLEKAHKCCPLQDVNIIADREFIGNEWFSYFERLELFFTCRIRQGMYKNNLTGNLSYSQLQKRALKKGQASGLIQVEGQVFRLWVIKKIGNDPKEPLIYILTNILNKRNTPILYQLRWKIECLFKHLKTNGYNLESLRMTNLCKIRLMFSMVVLAYIISILTALDERKEKPVKKKTYRDRRTFDVISVFKQGQSLIKQRFITLNRFLDLIQFLNVIVKASIPYNKYFVQ
jgi:Transposase DDE domain